MGTRILILSFYFPPDLSAGSFRVGALVDALHAKLPPGAEIDVVTTLPNRYHSFTADATENESREGLTVRRLALPAHKSGMVDQSVAFLSYARGVLAHTLGRRYDVVFATSSRLMTAVLGARVAARTGASLYLDIRDIFADTIKDVMKGVRGHAAFRLFSQLEAYAIKRAERINVVSGGFLEYFRTRYPQRDYRCFSNAIDDEFLAVAPATSSPSPAQAGPDAPVLLYAGNIGEGQGLNRIVPSIAEALGSRVRFRIIGDGGRATALKREVAERGLTNVEVLPPVSRAELIAAYRAADVLFLHLNDFAAFRKVLPSKVFEYAAMGKPILAGVSGFCAEFIRSEVSNASVFPPCDTAAAIRAMEQLQLTDAPRPEFLARFSRRAISSALADDILDLVRVSRAPVVFERERLTIR